MIKIFKEKRSYAVLRGGLYIPYINKKKWLFDYLKKVLSFCFFWGLIFLNKYKF